MFALLYTPDKKIVAPFSSEAEISQWLKKNEPLFELMGIGSGYYAHMARSGYHAGRRITIVQIQKS